MEQPFINMEIFGLVPIISLHWNVEGYLVAVVVDTKGNQREPITLYDHNNSGIFENIYGNMRGVLILK